MDGTTPACAVLALALLTFGFPMGAVPSASAVASPGKPSQPPDVFVNLTTANLMFDPAAIEVFPSATVHVRITQMDVSPHTFTLAAEKDRDLPTSWSPQELDAYLDGNNITDTAIPGGQGNVVWANFTAPSEQGRYEFVCRIAGHFQNGMFGFLTVSLKEAFVNITMTGLRFVPDRFTVPPNAMVYVRITQEDTVPHTFTVAAEKNLQLPSTWSPRELDTYFVGNNLTDVPVLNIAGTIVWANFTAPSVQGVYEFVCRYPGHFQGGMIGFMIVSQAPVIGQGLPLDPIQAIMLATIAFVLLFAAGYHVRAVRAHRRAR